MVLNIFLFINYNAKTYIIIIIEKEKGEELQGSFMIEHLLQDFNRASRAGNGL
jgi:hypothetical protein